ncbi:hypothetical protein IGS68_01125 [Skermanella sp. TT6]|uniref:Uncharacterized protein n=1 Tax=Skermanella cutis TaxID=2775420 RepID=A0ABX7BBU5_9PROT|nr:hypothetical protein [Skermanella sp. TT6]QQP89912.1 hypothetical protein IGS68_01125 [Skermanella sp. TT6]
MIEAVTTYLPRLAAAANVSQIDTGKAGDMVDREGFTSVSFTSVPPRGFDQLKDIARAQGIFPRDLFSQAIRQLLEDRKAGTMIDYPASRKGGVRRSLWLEDDLVEQMNEAATADNVSKTVLFLTALKRYAEREGIDVEV